MGYERGGRYGRDEDGRQARYGNDRGEYRAGGGDRYRADYGARGYNYGDRDGQSRSRDYGRSPQGYDHDDRGFFDRAGDEVRSWFGDEEAERRRRLDERYDERGYARDDRDRDRSRGYAGANTFGGFGADLGAGVYGAGNEFFDYRGGANAGADRQRARGGPDRDDHYRSWRDRQMEQFDRDYDDYRREHQSKFDQEFHGWRTNRQSQRDSLQRVREHQEVVGSDGKHVGTVDKVRGDTIVLTKQDQDAGGRHHSIPSGWITSVDDKVTISKTADDAHAHWRDAEKNSAFWNDDRSGQASGTATQQANRTGSR